MTKQCGDMATNNEYGEQTNDVMINECTNEPSSSLELYSEEVNNNRDTPSSTSVVKIDITKSEADSSNPSQRNKNPTKKSRLTPSDAKKKQKMFMSKRKKSFIKKGMFEKQTVW